MSITRHILTAALLAGAGHAVAASSVDLSVRGSITPSACELDIANGGAFELGKVSAKDLSPTSPTDLAEQTTGLAVTCEAATLMAIESTDNRAGSAHWDEQLNFGLGLINGTQKLGGLHIAVRRQVADGEAVYGNHSLDGGKTWANNGLFRPGGLSSVYKVSPMAPIPVQVLTAQMTIYPTIARTQGLTLTDEVPIDGSVTLTMRYL
ncbi:MULTISPECIES: DUF1120 domain-containing protein [Pseudomonas]|jgi:hypothetical protein|uniref:DUF1120 domain-containing protein n=1 Tax=Pseudomonas reactans TaxID=117680 RepID=A0A7Y8FZT2_9PSED|nr:DUF1120 domain-containing protein [Pseudomonas reactans]NWD82755.1 DUF1120 domain-containing protein [Pseudomonas reactans]NWE88592.1 DUF1120 domain-containing protein [Pseudomonas reactans]